MCIYVHVLYCYFTGIFYAVIRQISMLFIDNKDSVFSSTGDRLLLRLLMYNCTLCKSSLISSLCFSWRSVSLTHGYVKQVRAAARVHRKPQPRWILWLLLGVHDHVGHHRQ